MTTARRDRVRDVIHARQEGVLVFEDIHDPHNAAAAMRTADAFGFQHVCLIFEQEKPFNPGKIGRISSSSANKWLTFSIFRSTRECFTELKRQKYLTVATVCEDDAAESLFTSDFALTKRIAVFFGNEHRGLTRQAVCLADRRVTIPLRGMVQSLNLSVTTAVFLYEVTRQRIFSGMSAFNLSVRARAQLRRDFLHR